MAAATRFPSAVAPAGRRTAGLQGTTAQFCLRSTRIRRLFPVFPVHEVYPTDAEICPPEEQREVSCVLPPSAFRVREDLFCGSFPPFAEGAARALAENLGSNRNAGWPPRGPGPAAQANTPANDRPDNLRRKQEFA